MIRRRRHSREIPFSFDSFLDVVANVVGIIIRLILVAWVGARSYSSVVNIHRPGKAKAPEAVAAAEIRDPLQEELARHRSELADLQKRMLEQLRQLEDIKTEDAQLDKKKEELDVEEMEASKSDTDIDRTAGDKDRTIRTVALSMEELRQRREKLLADFREIEKQAPPKKLLHYRTPVSRPVQADEFFFECKNGRVTFLDIASLVTEIRQDVDQKGKALRDTWQIEETTPPIGAFRLRYVVERQRSLTDGLVPSASPDARAGYRYSVTGWTAEPVAAVRGETLTQAMAAGSEFRQITDRIDPLLGVVTFWVYPDSFALYRQLRDHLYERDLVVAGRPLPEGIPISSSRRGTVSRGQ
jgi:hypothetical protein